MLEIDQSATTIRPKQKLERRKCCHRCLITWESALPFPILYYAYRHRTSGRTEKERCPELCSSACLSPSCRLGGIAAQSRNSPSVVVLSASSARAVAPPDIANFGSPPPSNDPALCTLQSAESTPNSNTSNDVFLSHPPTLPAIVYCDTLRAPPKPPAHPAAWFVSTGTRFGAKRRTFSVRTPRYVISSRASTRSYGVASSACPVVQRTA